MGKLCQPISKEEHKRRLKLYKQGLNDTELAEAVGITRACIFRWRKKHGIKAVKKAGRTKLSPAENDKRMKLYMDGATDTYIAKKIGRSIEAVRVWRYARKLPCNFAPKPRRTEVIRAPRIIQRPPEEIDKFHRFVGRVLNVRMNHNSKLDTMDIIDGVMSAIHRGELEA